MYIISNGIGHLATPIWNPLPVSMVSWQLWYDTEKLITWHFVKVHKLDVGIIQVLYKTTICNIIIHLCTYTYQSSCNQQYHYCVSKIYYSTIFATLFNDVDMAVIKQYRYLYNVSICLSWLYHTCLLKNKGSIHIIIIFTSWFSCKT